MTLKEIRARKVEIRTVLENDKNADLDALEQELKDLESRENHIISDAGANGRVLGSVEDVVEKRHIEQPKEKSLELRQGEKLVDRIKLDPEERGLSLGKYVKGIVTGDWTDAAAERRAMNTSINGAIVPKELAAQVIDLARNESLFTLAGVPIVPMETNSLTYARVKQDPTFGFKAEGKEGVNGDFEIEGVELKAKTAYGYGYISLELLKSAANIEDVVSNVFKSALAECIDKAMLYGTENGPSGIMTDSSIHTVTAAEGDGYDSFIKAIGKVRGANGTPSVYAMNANTEEMLSLLKTTDGQYLAAPKAVEQMQGITTNQLKYDESEGSDALVFDPRAMVIGMQDQLTIEIMRETDECLKKGLVAIRVMSMLDCKTLRPSHIAKIEGIKA